MPETNKGNQWNRLVNAAKDAGATTGEEKHEAAPSTFVSRIIIPVSYTHLTLPTKRIV